MPHQKGIKSVAQNRKAWHDYFVEEKYECGLALFGTEVKSIRQGRVNLKESWAQIRGGEIWVEGMHISPYDQGNIFNRDPMRPKKLLMHKSEIRKLDGLVSRQGYTLVPLEIYLKDGRMKLQLGLCRGKAEHDKRDTIAKRDADRDIRRALREHNKYPKGSRGRAESPLSLPQERNLLPQKKPSNKELLTAGRRCPKEAPSHSWG